MRHDELPRVRIVSATVHGRYLIRATRQNPPRGWLVGFHGYAQNAAMFLESLRQLPGSEEWLIASVQALHPFYARSNEIVANWMTRQDREHAIADNIAYVDQVLADMAIDFGIPSALVFAGFSQGVAMAYRAGLCGRSPCSAIIVSGGDVPPELTPATGRLWPPVLVCTGKLDTSYTPARMEEDIELLRSRGAEVHSLVFEGGHEWSQEVIDAASEMLAAVTQ
jgi:predicted esterase